MDLKEKREKFIRDAKSNIILDAARKVFAEKGFHQTRLEEIATEAGFSKASLYNYYSDKFEIFMSLANREFDLLLEKLRVLFKPQEHLLENFENLFRVVLSFFGEHFAFVVTTMNFRAMCENMQVEIEKDHILLLNEFKNKFNKINKMQLMIIENARLKNEIKIDLDDETVSVYITSLIRGIIFEWKIRGGMGDIEKEINNLLLFLKSALVCL
ncbi:MAG: helix-turn-helix transcriptional regulator [Chitinispirillaceae bacterium]|nr:helix-turn-helix transcriptional regulator [Chitinispirillaceae bacterium]